MSGSLGAKDKWITLESAINLVKKYHGSSVQVQRIVPCTAQEHSLSSDHRTFILDCVMDTGSGSSEGKTCFLTLAQPLSDAIQTTSEELEYRSNNLQTSYNLLSLAHGKIHPPIPSMPLILWDPGRLDTSKSLIQYHYILSPLHPVSSSNLVPLADARRSGNITADVLASVELRLGHFFGQLHSQVQNEWFGMPVAPSASPPSSSSIPGLSITINEPPHETGYSWQETFTALLEDLLARLQREDEKSASASEPRYGQLSYADIRKHLSKAIGSFLFDDVEVPSLVWFTGSEEDVFIVDPTSVKEGSIVAVLPSMTHAIWGDPLLETTMLGPEDPSSVGFLGLSPAFKEGYRAGGGQELIVFSRHKTKRLWYNVFLALVILVGDNLTQSPEYGDTEKGKRAWARDLLYQSVELLKDAPCY